MTCIVALVDEQGLVHFGGDSLAVNVPNQYNSIVSQTVRKEPKIWTRDGMVFGANGSVRMLQLLRYVLEIPPYHHIGEDKDHMGEDKVKYLVTKFIPALKDCFVKSGYQEEDCELRGNILLSLGKELFTIGAEFQICNTADGYESIGKAQEVAIGSLHTTNQLNLPPRERLYLALKAAERHTCVVSEPFHYINSEMEQAEPLDINDH